MIANEWIINESLYLIYVSGVATYSIPSATSTELDSPTDFVALMVLHISIQLSFMVYHHMLDSEGAVFEVPA